MVSYFTGGTVYRCWLFWTTVEHNHIHGKPFYVLITLSKIFINFFHQSASGEIYYHDNFSIYNIMPEFTLDVPHKLCTMGAQNWTQYTILNAPIASYNFIIISLSYVSFLLLCLQENVYLNMCFCKYLCWYTYLKQLLFLFFVFFLPM